jgi:serine/threonine-protein kinase HipA
MYRPIDAVEVRIWDRTVGAVALDPRLGFYVFEYDPRWVRGGIELAPLHMPLRLADEPFVFPDLPPATYHRLPAMLADALPDRFGNALVTAYLEREGVPAAAITPLDRLAYMGQRALGAIEFRPARGPRAGTRGTALELRELVDTARAVLRGELTGSDDDSAALAALIRVGTSAGGARAKAVIAWNRETGEIRPGQFDVPAGFEHWLLKFDGVGEDAELGATQHYGRIEYAYALMARAAGIEMSECRLIEEGGRAHFVTRRFDRDGGRKVHVQTLCAVAHLDFNQRATHDYAQLMSTLRALGLGEDARVQAFRRMVFNVMAANCDDHTKNVSFLLRDGSPWGLAPAYDVTYAFNPRSQWTYQHLMGVGGTFSKVTREHLLDFADRHDVPAAAKLIDQVSAAIGTWPECAKEAGLPRTDALRITAHHVRV